MRRTACLLWLPVLVTPGCGGTGEAADPSAILGEDVHYQGADGSAPASAGTPGADPAQQPASEADCRRAAKNLVALGYDMAVAEEPDATKQEELREQRGEALNDENAQQLVNTWTKECLERGDSKAVAHCLARLKSENDVGKCDPGP